MNLSRKKIVVIGGGGLIGSHTVDQLVQEDVKEIIVYDNFVRGTIKNLENALKDSRVKIYDKSSDICHVDKLNLALKDADGVFHFAALWLLECHEYPARAFETNIRGTFNVLEACVAQNVKRLVYSSSASVYGDAVYEPMDENHPFNNKNFYGATKIAGEAMMRAYFHRYGLPYVGLRYMNVYGPRQDYRGAYIAVIMKILDDLDKGIAPRIYGDGSQAYDFVYVEDCAMANIYAMKSETEDQFYNVATGIRTSIQELAKLIIKMRGLKIEPQYEPAGMTFVKNRIGCPKKAENELFFKAKTNLERGLKALIEWRDTHIKTEICPNLN